jgi:hypothetical protein
LAIGVGSRRSRDAGEDSQFSVLQEATAMSVTDPNGAPQILRDHPGMKDFFRSYEQRVDKLNEDLMQVVRRLPSLDALVRRMTPSELAESNRVSMENMRKAIVDGDWAPLLERQRSDGATYAAMGIPFREWFDLVAAFQSSLIPFLVADYGGRTRPASVMRSRR